jgi:hypothetical protein
MNFSKPTRFNNECFKSVCNPFKIEDQETLDKIEREIVKLITKKSLEWFNKEFTLKEVEEKYTKKTFEKGLCLKGITFYSKRFELDTVVEKEKSFFDYLFSLGASDETQEPESATVETTEPKPEPVEPIVEESVSEHVSEHISEPVVEKTEVQETEEVQSTTEIPSEPVVEMPSEPVVEMPSETVVEMPAEPVVENPEVSMDNEYDYEFDCDECVDVNIKGKWVKAVVCDTLHGLYTVKLADGSMISNITGDQMKKFKRHKQLNVIKQLQKDLQVHIENKDYDNAFKLTQILKQYNKQ